MGKLVFIYVLVMAVAYVCGVEFAERTNASLTELGELEHERLLQAMANIIEEVGTSEVEAHHPHAPQSGKLSSSEWRPPAGRFIGHGSGRDGHEPPRGDYGLHGSEYRSHGGENWSRDGEDGSLGGRSMQRPPLPSQAFFTGAKYTNAGKDRCSYATDGTLCCCDKGRKTVSKRERNTSAVRSQAERRRSRSLARRSRAPSIAVRNRKRNGDGSSSRVSPSVFLEHLSRLPKNQRKLQERPKGPSVPKMPMQVLKGKSPKIPSEPPKIPSEPPQRPLTQKNCSCPTLPIYLKRSNALNKSQEYARKSQKSAIDSQKHSEVSKRLAKRSRKNAIHSMRFAKHSQMYSNANDPDKAKKFLKESKEHSRAAEGNAHSAQHFAKKAKSCARKSQEYSRKSEEFGKKFQDIVKEYHRTLAERG